jgi:hypothetical protein
MNYDILTVLRVPELTSGRPFPGLTNAAPPPRKWEMIRCAWSDGCRTWSVPQMSYESASTLSKWLHWMNYDILIILREPELTSEQPFLGLTNAAPPPRKMRNDQMRLRQWLKDMVRPPDVEWECINVVKWIHWMNYDILTVLRVPELTSGRPFPGLTNAAPPPCFRDQIG